jgi:hypothetical protein
MDREQIMKRLREDLVSAQQRHNAASEKFDRIISEVPSGVPHPDGTDRIFQASREYSQAHKEVLDAFVSLNNYLIHGTVPPNLTEAD